MNLHYVIFMNSTPAAHTQYVVVRRRRMTTLQHEPLRRAARKMVKDFRKFVRRKRL